MKKRMSVVLSMALVMGIMGQCAIAVNAASKTDDDTPGKRMSFTWWSGFLHHAKAS